MERPVDARRADHDDDEKDHQRDKPFLAFGLLPEQLSENDHDHRSFRVKDDSARKAWLVDGLKKVEQLAFLCRDRTLAQAAIKFILTEPSIGSVLPNIYNEQQLEEFAAAPDTMDLNGEELARVNELYRANFGIPSPALVR